MHYLCGGVQVDVEIGGEVMRGGAEVLARQQETPIYGNVLFRSGFAVFPFLEAGDFRRLRKGLVELLMQAVESATGSSPQEFSLESYHQFCPDDLSHGRVITWLRDHSDLGFFPIEVGKIDARISQLCSTNVSSRVEGEVASGHFFLRIVRPLRPADNNPPHRDSWLERLSRGVNAYIPLAGSNHLSALPVIPDSHLWPECDIERTKQGAIMNGVKFSVPAVASSTRTLDMLRPAVSDNQVMLFSPHLLHGGAVNFNLDMTRVSLEMRFWRVP